jgi:alcohol dehydrogenase class IV
MPHLDKFGLGPGDIPAMVALASRSNSMRSNPVKLPEQVLADILTKVL